MNGLGQPLPSDAGNRCFASWIYFGKKQEVGLIEGHGKFVYEILGPGVTMGLKEHHKPAICPPLRRREGRLDFRWMVSIVIDDGDAALLPHHLEPPFHPGESLQGFGDLRGGDAQFQADRDRGQGVSYVMDARHGNPEASQILSVKPRGKLGCSVLQLNIDALKLSALVESISLESLRQ